MSPTDDPASSLQPPASSGVAIVTDSTACLPPDLAEQYQIEVVPLHLLFAGRTFVDSLATDTSEFYELLRSSKERPSTAAPSPGMFLSAIGRAASRADAVLCITVSKQFSAMYDSAQHAIELARAESPHTDIRLLDSRNAAMAQGFVVLEAARAAARGASIEDVVARAEAMTAEVSLLAMLDTLSYLARSGRVPRAAAWAAGMLQVKPIVRFSASDIKLVARTRTRPRALDRMVDLLAEATAGRLTHLAVHHAHAPADAEYLLVEAERRVLLAESYLTEFTQVMGVHTGPGLAGFAWWCESSVSAEQRKFQLHHERHHPTSDF
ncbi:MAG: DegV family protein [Chloroflexota bacterium]|nr:DegV family protein [Chloroflexota bacterium]